MVLSSVRSMAFAPTEPELAELWDALQRLLTARGLNHVITYIKNEWMSCVKHWSLAHVRWQDHGLVHPCITNNTIERVFRTFKYTVLEQRMNRRVDAILFDAIPRMAAWYYRGVALFLVALNTSCLLFPTLMFITFLGLRASQNGSCVLVAEHRIVDWRTRLRLVKQRASHFAALASSRSSNGRSTTTARACACSVASPADLAAMHVCMAAHCMIRTRVRRRTQSTQARTVGRGAVSAMARARTIRPTRAAAPVAARRSILSRRPTLTVLATRSRCRSTHAAWRIRRARVPMHSPCSASTCEPVSFRLAGSRCGV